MSAKSRHLGFLAAALFAAAGCLPNQGQTQGQGQAGNGSGNSGGSAMAGNNGGGGTGMAGVAGASGLAGAGQGGVVGTAGMGAGGAGNAVACTPLAPLPRRVWRLSVEQYGNAVRDLLGLTATPVLTNRGGQAAYAFFSDVALGVDESFQYALYEASEQVLRDIAPRITQIAACNAGEAQTACATRFAQTFGAKAFRRPLAASEVTTLMNVYTQGVMQDFNTAIGLMIQAMIISPSFVYRTELGPATLTADASGRFPDTTLTPHEVATQLGFLLTGSTPDTALLAAAADGSLATTAGITTQINRLFTLATTKAHLTGVLIDWFNVRQMFDKGKDTALLAALPAAEQNQMDIQNDLLNSTQRFVTDVLWTNPGTINDLLTSQKVFVNRRLATLYPGLTYAGGAAAPANNTTWVSATWPASQGRAGMLTQPSVMWSASDPALTSVVKRGKFIQDDIICQDAVPPPIDLSSPAAMNILAMGDSEITKSDARMANQPCKSCHAFIDPYARAVHNFGPIGNYRTTDEAGRTIDPSYTFTGGPLLGMSIAGSSAMAQALVQTGVINGCAVQKVTSYTIGSMIHVNNTCEVNQVRTQTDGTITSLFRQVALANFTRARTGGMR
jgi:hypothetical protein